MELRKEVLELAAQTEGGVLFGITPNKDELDYLRGFGLKPKSIDFESTGGFSTTYAKS